MTEHVEILVEELSAERALRILVPRIVPAVGFSVRTFNGKTDLLRKLPDRLAGYASWVRDAQVKVMILIDRDDDDCHDLKQRLELQVAKVGLTTPSTAPGARPADVCVRIAVEELEAWFLGDVPALRAAYPRLPHSLARRTTYRDPDNIAGGTAEALERLLSRHGYGQALAKVDNATEVAQHMDVEMNRSASFCAFRDGLRQLLADERHA